MEIPFAIGFLSSFPDFQHRNGGHLGSRHSRRCAPISSHYNAIFILTQISFILNGFSKKLFLFRPDSCGRICVDFCLKIC